MKIIAKTHVSHNNKAFLPDEEVTDLSPEQAAALVKCGAAVDVEAEADAAKAAAAAAAAAKAAEAEAAKGKKASS